MQVQEVIFKAQELSNGSEYEFKGVLMPNGSVLVSYETTNDGWFTSLDEVNACGDAMVTGWEIGEKYRMSRANVRESLKGAISEFGADAGTRKGYKLLA